MSPNYILSIHEKNLEISMVLVDEFILWSDFPKPCLLDYWDTFHLIPRLYNNWKFNQVPLWL